MEWFSFFSVLWFIFFIYIPYVYIGLSWEFMTLFAFFYMAIKWKRWDYFRSWRFWRYLESTVDLKVCGNPQLLQDDSRAYLFAFYPHGTHCVSACAVSVMEETKHIRVACTTVLFWTPIINAFIGWGNALPADKRLMQHELHRGTSLIVYPGGISEIPNGDFLREPEYALKKDQDESQFTYNRRNGFIELAKNMSVPIVPVWVEGEYQLFTTWFPLKWLSKWCYKVFRYPWPMFSSGHYGTFLPKHVPMRIYVGLPQETTPEMSTSDIKQKHLAQLEQLKKLARDEK